MEVSDNNNLEMATPIVDKLGRSYATGKRKNAVARVWLKSGTGKVSINGKESNKYFSRPVLNMLVNQPLELTKRKLDTDVMITVSGGGLSGQAGAVRHGISKALSISIPSSVFDPFESTTIAIASSYPEL